MKLAYRRFCYYGLLLAGLSSFSTLSSVANAKTGGTLRGDSKTDLHSTQLLRINDQALSFDLGTHVVYVSPVAGSKYLTPGTSIIVRSDENISPDMVRGDLFYVVGSATGAHAGTVTLATDDRTLIFQPDAPFAPGDSVNVSFTHPLLSVMGDTVSLNPFSFTISDYNLNANQSEVSEIGYGIPKMLSPAIEEQHQQAGVSKLSTEFLPSDEPDTLPADLPIPTVTKTDSPSSGFIFLATNMNHATYKKYGDYLMILDNNGDVLFYRNTGIDPAWDFNIQPTGQLTYFTPYGKGWDYIMNTSLQVSDSMSAANGYYADGHEMRILPNGNIFILADDYEYIDMSKIVPGGRINAKLIDVVVQEFDKNGNLIFNWR
ncbi:MAG: aryl-sulfate sulfotransferase, partial [Bacteroidetes bacterium]|nr:aryl-sulfate sulfotransferase [Bacteroidota bacterium]